MPPKPPKKPKKEVINNNTLNLQRKLYKLLLGK